MTEAPGLGVFTLESDGSVYRTYSCYGRELNTLMGAYHYLDLVPKGRDEDDLPYPTAWLRHHDRAHVIHGFGSLPLASNRSHHMAMPSARTNGNGPGAATKTAFAVEPVESCVAFDGKPA